MTRVPSRELREGWATELDYVSPALGAHAVSLRVYQMHPGRGAGPTHYHSESESIYYVLAGRVVVTLEGRHHELGRGDLAFIAPGATHSIETAGGTEASILELYAPGEADFVHVAPRTD